MKRRIVFFLTFWAAIVAVMMLLTGVFVLVEPGYGMSGLRALPRIWAAGFSMNLSMSAYLLAPAALWLAVSVWLRPALLTRVLRGYMWFVAALIAVVYVVDGMLYPYWGFRLESTPVFYFLSSPKAAFASTPWWLNVLGLLGTAGLTWGLYRLFALSLRIFGQGPCDRNRVLSTVTMAVLAGLLIIPIRGGLTVSTMSPGRAYFTDDMHLNQAAVNPMFNFVYSMSHIDNLEGQFNYYPDAQARTLVNGFLTAGNDVPTRSVAGQDKNPDGGTSADSLPRVTLRDKRPDIYLVILESFSGMLMPSLGGDSVAVCLDSIARRGVLFTDFYGESFRTDRGLSVILSGYPSQPTTSLFRYSSKFDKLPSLARQLRRAGYDCRYFYGGDINFTNQRGYLHATGFGKMVSDEDFPISERLSKWGVHDNFVYDRALADIAAYSDTTPHLSVIQTSSSHEPFQVPYHNPRFAGDDRLNAFAYADSCLGDFVRRLAATSKWNNALVIIVPDHWGAWPRDNKDPYLRHHIPLVMIGGALQGTPARIDYPTSQSGIAPTVLALMGLDNSMFPFARNMLSGTPAGQFAWMSEPDWFGLKTPGTSLTVVPVDESGARSAIKTGADTLTATRARAFVQLIYDDLTAR